MLPCFYLVASKVSSLGPDFEVNCLLTERPLTVKKIDVILGNCEKIVSKIAGVTNNDFLINTLMIAGVYSIEGLL